MMVAAELTERRRIAVLDGDGRHELVLASGVVVSDALARMGVALEPGRRVLLGHDGRELKPDARAEDLSDGAVVALVDLTERPPVAGRGPSAATAARGVASVWWMLAAAAILTTLVALVAPDAIEPAVRVALAVVAGAGALVSATVWAVRGRTDHPLGAAEASAPLLLAFAAGVVAIPPLPASTGLLAVVTGLGAAAVLSALLGVVAGSGFVRAQLGTATLILLGLVAVWGLALALGVPVSAPAAVSLGAVQLALRALPSTLLDVPPGMFIDYRRFQTARWTVRQQLPADGGGIASPAARDLVGHSSARLVAGTILLSAVAAVCAPFAIPGFGADDPIVLAGRIAVAACAILALVLGSRRSTAPLLRWMPRAAAVAVGLAALAAAIRISAPVALTVVAGIMLAAGVTVALVVVPIGRGSRSLFWSRLGDVLEWLAVALALPAGLLAADALDLLRGMMA